MTQEILQSEPQRGIGDNSSNVEICVEVRAFNSLVRFMADRSRRCQMALPAGSTVADILSQLNIPEHEVFLVLCNGKDITPGLKDSVDTNFQPKADDVIALSGPVPYSWGYGAPVV